MRAGKGEEKEGGRGDGSGRVCESRPRREKSRVSGRVERELRPEGR